MYPPRLFDEASITDELHKASLSYDDTAAFARALGMTGPSLAHILAGRVPPGGRTCAFLGVRRVFMYELVHVESPYTALGEEAFIRRSRRYEAAREHLRAEIAEQGEIETTLPMDGSTAAEDAYQLAVHHAHARNRASRTSRRRSMYLMKTPLDGQKRRARANVMGLAHVVELAKAPEDASPYQLKQAFARLRQVMHPNSRASVENKILAKGLYEKLRGNPAETKPTPRRGAPAPAQLKAGQIEYQKKLLRVRLATGKIVVVTSDTPAIMAAAEEMVISGEANRLEAPREMLVKGGPIPQGMATRRKRIELRIVTGDTRI